MGLIRKEEVAQEGRKTCKVEQRGRKQDYGNP